MLESPGEYTYLLYYIKGAEQYVTDFAANKPVDFNNVGIEALDPRTLRVTLNDPVAFFYDLCAFPTFLPLHKKSMDRFARVDEKTGRTVYDGQFTRPPYIVSNGPYELKRWDFKTRLVLEKNPNYWDRDNVKCDSIEMAVVDDPLTQLLRYESGSVDWIASVPTEVAAEMKKKGRPDLKSFGAFGTTYSLADFPALVEAAPKGLFLTGTPVLELDRDTGTGMQTLCFVDQTNHDKRIGYYTDTYRRTEHGWRLHTRSMTFLRRSGARDSGQEHDPRRPPPTSNPNG
jgi:hypothetical protein